MSLVPTSDGHWVSEDFARLAEIIQDYDEDMELVWIPPDKRTDPMDDRRAFAIVDNVQGLEPYVIMYIDINDDPKKVLAKLFENDVRRHSPEAVINRIDMANAAAELFRKKQQMEIAEEQADKIRFLFSSPLNYVKLDPGVKLDSHRRRVT